MANLEHLAILKQGVEVWNKWRKAYFNTQPDLREANLFEANLEKVDFRGTTLVGANLYGADLQAANLEGVNLHGADLSFAHLWDAVLFKANLFEADLTGADLCRANLEGANLEGANLKQADLEEANFKGVDLSRARLVRTRFNNTSLDQACLFGAELSNTALENVDLREVKGLNSVDHYGLSEISISTLIRSHGTIPEIFLRKAGVPQSIIEQIPALVGSLNPIDYYSCFISYSSNDEDFAKRLYADLQSNNVRCWFAPHDLRLGTVIIRGIDEAIRVHDKLLLILSKDSAESNWVEHEVDRALFKEMERKRQDVLFPIRMDNAVLKNPSEWAKNLCHRHIGDFTKWKDHDNYQQEFNRLLRDLKAETSKKDE